MLSYFTVALGRRSWADKSRGADKGATLAPLPPLLSHPALTVPIRRPKNHATAERFAGIHDEGDRYRGRGDVRTNRPGLPFLFFIINLPLFCRGDGGAAPSPAAKDRRVTGTRVHHVHLLWSDLSRVRRANESRSA